MKMAINILLALLVVAGFLFLAKTEITISPFSLKMKAPLNAVGWILLSVGVSLIAAESRRRGYKEGSEETIEVFTKTLDQAGMKTAETDKK
jgi:hypothetical protein